MPEVNVPLLRKALEWAEAEAAKPEGLCEWDQVRLDPSSGPERAGWLRPTNSLEQAHVVANNIVARMHKDPACGTCYCIAGWVVYEVDGQVDLKTVEKRARELLGLTGTQSIRLFGGGNSIQDVRRIAEHLAGERL